MAIQFEFTIYSASELLYMTHSPAHKHSRKNHIELLNNSDVYVQ